MTKAIAQTYNVVNEYKMRISLIFMAVSVIMMLFYITNVYSVISHTVTIQKINAEITAIEKVVENLDAQYLGLSSKITPDSLNIYGMSQGKVSEYISKTSYTAFGRAVNVSSVAMSAHEF
ncbi:MAG: hypothetical protein WC666_02725 [Candidatus Paceibacterota bacterium]|jgi:hypothetical protein